jgi:urea transport system permease protein
LPWFWWGFDHFAYAAAMVMLVPGVFALVFGWLAFRSRVTGVYLSIITQAMTYALWLAFFRNDMGFGGNNGLTDYKDILGWDVHLPETRLGLYLASVVGLGVTFLACRFIIASKLGRVLLAVRDAESRVRFLGYSTTRAKLFVFTVSAVFAGIAGALYVPQVGIINPSEFSPGNSIEIAIWVSVGGRGTLIGAMLGAALVNLAKTWLTGAAPEIWLFFLGGLFVLTTLAFPRGLVGALRYLRWTRPRAPAGAVPAPAGAKEPS